MYWLKSKVFLFLITLNWGSLILLMLPFMLISLAYDKLINSNIKWLYSAFLAQDHLVSVIMGGHYLTTISSELGNQRRKGSKAGTQAANFVDWLFKMAIGELRHCDNAMQKDDIYQFSARRAIAGTVVYWLSLFNYLVIYFI